MNMFNKEEALSIWEHEMGKKEYAYDFAGKKIKFDAYLKNNEVGWVITFLRPLSLGGSNNLNNIIIMHHRTFNERNDQYPKFTIDEKEYIVHHNVNEDYYYLEKIIDDDNDDDYGVIL